MRGAAARGSVSASALVQACASLGALSAGAIHLSTASEHDGLYATGFLAMAAFQVTWALLVAVRPSARLMALGIVGSLAIVAIWAVAHTAGLPFGPTPGEAESTGVKDLAATVLELVTVAAAVALLRRGVTARPVAALAWAPGVVAIAALTSVAIATPHAHRGEEHSGDGMQAGDHRGEPRHAKGSSHPRAALASAKVHHRGREGRRGHHRGSSRSRGHGRHAAHSTAAGHAGAGHAHLAVLHTGAGHSSGAHHSSAGRSGTGHRGHARGGRSDGGGAQGHGGHHQHGGGGSQQQPAPPPPSDGGQPGGGEPSGPVQQVADLLPLPR
jgi:tracheal colonization factor